ncbi:MAG TPA: T9SS type A sorting domain-containing protein, partial [Ignavibacteriaceae bacterium]|nr:T9SS type A sorting domain-containing protein [Ignavibacteriaceae bacterium]
KSYPPFDPVLIEFDSMFFSDQNKFNIQLVVKKDGLRIDSLSQPFHADFGLSVDDSGIIPNEFSLSQNYPNPFNPVTNIGFTISDFGFVSLKVYDILGNEIATLVSEEKQPGNYEVEFNINSHSGEVRNLSSGIYFYQLLVSALQSKDGKAGDYTQTRKMILLK